MIQYKIDTSEVFENECGAIRYINTLNNEEIGYLEFSSSIYYDEQDTEEASTIYSKYFIELMESVAELSLNELYIDEKYRKQGFANILLKYFCNTYCKNKICVVQYSAFGYTDNSVCEYHNKFVLPKLYNKYGFKQIDNTNYMVRWPNLKSKIINTLKLKF